MAIRRVAHLAALLSGTILSTQMALPAFAADDGVGQVEEILVVARRKEERLQDVPISITVKSQQELIENNIQSIGELQRFTPSLKAFGPYRDQPILSLRGQGGYSPSGLPSVILYLNEVPVATSAQAGSPGGALGGNDMFFDLENVQVVKGPQGTLFGRNTTGGAILVQSARPKDEFGGSALITVGNYNDKEFQAVVNVPVVSDKLLVRLAMSGQERDGFTITPTPHHPEGLDQDNAEYIAGRLSVLARLSPAAENLLIAEYVNSTKNGTSSVLKDVNPALNFLFPGLTATLAQQQALGIRRGVPIGVDTVSDLNRLSLTDILPWELNDNLTFRNIANYQRARYVRTIDGDGTIYPIFDPIFEQAIPYVTHQFSEEAQLQWRLLDGKIDGAAGYFFLTQPKEDNFTQHTAVVFGSARHVGYRQSESTHGVYLQADFDLASVLDGLSFTAGSRYTWETIERSERDVRLATGACSNLSANPATCVVDRGGSFRSPTWTFGLNYKVAPETMLYAVTRRGFRSGGFNLQSGTPAADITVNPEYVTDVELGIKSQWSFGSIDVLGNLAAYRQYYTDIQLTQIISSPLVGSLTVVKNAGEAVIDGVEGEFHVNFDDRFEFGGDFGYIDFEYTKLDPGVVLPVIPTVPKWTYGIDTKLHLVRDERIGHIYVNASYNWTAGFYSASLTTPDAYQSAYGLLNLGASWRDVGGHPVDVSFFMTNALNRVFALGTLPLRSSLGTSTVAYGPPRMFGFRFGYRFGAAR